MTLIEKKRKLVLDVATRRVNHKKKRPTPSERPKEKKKEEKRRETKLKSTATIEMREH